MKVKYLIFAWFIMLFSCAENMEKKPTENVSNDNKKEILKYAKGFEIEYVDGVKLITIHDPWQGAKSVEYKYALVDKENDIKKIDKAWTIIEAPVNKVVCLSTTHVAFIDILNETSTIVGVSGSNYVNNTKVRERIDNNKVFDVGYDNSLNFELIASLNPDLVITYGIGSQVTSYNQKLNDLGINTIIIAEYLENHPLGKLEWIKLMASFYNKEEQANAYFEKVEKEYNQLLGLVDDVKDQPKVFFGLPWKDTWYVPGGKSFLAKMVEDAGGDYIWKNNESRESLPFDIESIFVNASSADIWLNTGTVNTKSDIIKTDERFDDFIPLNKGKIYNNNLRMNDYGGNDYWESGLVEPHIVLKDMIRIIHPDLLPEHKLVYYKCLK